jgi:preprotein translocase subunit YajC
MLDIAHFFIASAYAQTPGAISPPGGSNTSVFVNFLPLILIFGVFYVLVIRPQQKKIDEQNKMVKALQRGDRIVTSGGIYGKITRLDGDDDLLIEIANGVEIKIVRSHVQGLASKPQPVAVIEEKKS